MANFIKLNQCPVYTDGVMVSTPVWINAERIFGFHVWTKRVYHAPGIPLVPTLVTSVYSGSSQGTEDAFSFEVIETPEEIISIINAQSA